jgi:hypothetical protein
MVDHSTQVADYIERRLIATLLRSGALQATFVASFLDNFQEVLRQRGESMPIGKLPLSYLLEVGALGQLAIWEAEGLVPHIASILPTYRESKAELVQRATTNPQQFKSLEAATLSKTITRVICRCFAWEAQLILQADVVIGSVDDDLLVDALASLVWSMRHSLDHTSLESK